MPTNTREMEEIINRLESLLQQLTNALTAYTNEDLSRRTKPEKWSKKEILGHLIDSGINNLQRFTEVQFKEKPYVVKTYNQNELVRVNNYQEAALKEIFVLLSSINHRIIEVMKFLTAESLEYEVIIEGKKKSDLKFLVVDYVDHFEHHVKQIIT